MMVTLENEAGLKRQVKVGFSWTAFFFGGIPYFFRGIPSRGIMWILLNVFTCGISNIFLMFLINKHTAQYYLENGYKPIGDGWDIAGPKWGVSVGPPEAISATNS